MSSPFTVGNGTKQGGVLSPCLFNCYVRDLILAVMSTKIGCNIGGLFTNIIFAYADDIVLLAPSLADCVFNIDICCAV